VRKRFYKFSKIGPQIAYALGLGPIVGRKILLLTTTGRKTGLPRVTPLQYEEIDGCYYLGSAMGTQSDWYKNLETNPKVTVRVGRKTIQGIAETTSDLTRVADFLEYRLARSPRMLGAIMGIHGSSTKPTRAQIEEYSKNRAMVIIRPV
jgi:deazaflavin-dependent oxidoreductase (nitroreductase family)